MPGSLTRARWTGLAATAAAVVLGGSTAASGAKPFVASHAAPSALPTRTVQLTSENRSLAEALAAAGLSPAETDRLLRALSELIDVGNPMRHKLTLALARHGGADRVVQMVVESSGRRVRLDHRGRASVDELAARPSGSGPVPSDRLRVLHGPMEQVLYAEPPPPQVVAQFAAALGSVEAAAPGVRLGDDLVLVYTEANGAPPTLEYAAVRGSMAAVLYRTVGRDGRSLFLRDGAASPSTPRPARLSPLMIPARVTSGFGRRRHPILGWVHQHRGVDYAAPTGTAVRAVAAGRVMRAGWMGGYGRAVTLSHADGSETLYAHLSAISPQVRAGEQVDAGQHIGAVGASGLATGPHLHFEVRREGRAVDPRPRAAPPTAEPAVSVPEWRKARIAAVLAQAGAV